MTRTLSPLRVAHCTIPVRVAMTAVFAFATFCASAQDAVQTDGEKYKAIFENECVRVLDYRDEPGQKTHQHRHPNFVLVAMEPFQRRITLPDGKTMMREFKRGDTMWSDAQTHIGENVGTTPTRVVIVELKQPASGTGNCAKR